MHRSRVICSLLIFICGSIATIGLMSCESARHSYAATNDTFITAVEQVTKAYDRGEISQVEWDEDVKPAINLGDAALDQYDTLTRRGFSGEGPIATVREVLEILGPFIERLSREDE